MISVVTAWYNEEFLAPIFLNHYRYAEKIYVLVDEGTTDLSPTIALAYPNVVLQSLRMPEGMDDVLKQEQINEVYDSIVGGWVIAVDADEFIKEPMCGMADFLKTEFDHVVKVRFYNMYQHTTEDILNQRDPVFEQRRHGVPWAKIGFKPCIARSGTIDGWHPGVHNINGKGRYSQTELIGAHWRMADMGLALERRIAGRRDRMSQANVRRKLTTHDFDITKEAIIEDCITHQDCPLVFEDEGKAAA